MANTTQVLLNIARRSPHLINHVQRRNMPVNVPPTATGKRRFRLSVETDPHKLVNYCCGLNYIKDQPMVKLKPDNEYPDWLWTLRLGPKPKSWELEEGTKEYYLALKEEENEQNYLKRLKKAKPKKMVGEHLLFRESVKEHKKSAALAHMEDDVGLEPNELEKDFLFSRYATNVRVVNQREYYLPMEENRVIFMDKVKGNTHLKNFYRDEESSFKRYEVRVAKRPPLDTPPIYDSRRRHPYTGN